ncbi:MAG: NO-inducible flavohemoprotein [Aquabacterium sp.]|jgi:nitric oxide dioxygenase|uniref:NO-inducible flavohemoprotein n=1 Tax=Aquabacterium sp. TaxID=1872578 RepID=UPI002A3586EA|nr:NO-inducible flavohemoprotein [Aquabacterium sp.]MDX9842918.1 NO-inducible flavohemoprotein [Aquabacterium sp.]
MLDQTTRDLVKATAPILKEHGVTLTRHFYARMFTHNPELKPIFNQGHQQAGAQQQALAMAVAAYAEHIENPSMLAPVLTLVANKHASLGIRPEHYPIVGKHLLASIREVLGEAATDALIDAWAAAYGQLADLLIAQEKSLYEQAASQPNGWSGWRGFKVKRKVQESDEITSLHLTPADGGGTVHYQPGQYTSVRVFVPALGIMQPRQYSLSAAPGGSSLRISVKREAEQDGSPAGMVSNLLHDQIQVGDVIELAPPMGEFVLHEDRDTPVVLLSAGVGITPMLAMLDHLIYQGSQREIHFLHACRHGGVHAFREHVANLTAEHPRLRSVVHYEFPRAQDRMGQDFHHEGRIDKAALSRAALPADADCYLCGPEPFMQAQRAHLLELGVAAERIHVEAFGTGGVAA